MRVRGRAWAVLVLAASAACGDRPAIDTITVRDSAGITIVANPHPDGLPAYATVPEPITRIGVLEGDRNLQLYSVRAGAVLDDGRIVLLNAGTSEVRWFDPSGAFLASQGRTGDGPGEYRRPSVIFPFGPDSLAVWDASLRRLAVLDRDGGLGRMLRLSADLMSPNVLAAFSDRTLVVLDQRFDPNAPTEGFQDLPGPVTTHGPAGEPTGDTLSVTRWATFHVLVTPSTAEARGRAFEIGPSRAVVSDGLWVGDPRRAEIVLHARDGSGPVRIVRWPDRDRTVTAAHREAFLESRLAAAPNEEIRRALRQIADQQEFAAVLPAFRSVGTDADERIWVRTYDPPGVSAPVRWWVFDGEGRALHSVDLPEGATLLWASADRVLLGLRDALDVEQVELRRLVAAPGE